MAAMGVAVANSPAAAAAVPPVVQTPPAAAPGVSSGTAPPAAVAAVPAPPPSAESKFGEENLKKEKRPAAAPSDKVMLSTIASIKEVRPKLFLIVLANGQIWLQEGTQITSFFKAGYDARIEKGLFGDYRMSTVQTGEQNMVRVSRIQ
jgi:hypothetical protein